MKSVFNLLIHNYFGAQMNYPYVDYTMQYDHKKLIEVVFMNR